MTLTWCYLKSALLYSSNHWPQIAGFLSWAHFALKLDHFCPKVRLNSPLKLGSKCWKIHTAHSWPKSRFGKMQSSFPIFFLEFSKFEWDRITLISKTTLYFWAGYWSVTNVIIIEVSGWTLITCQHPTAFLDAHYLSFYGIFCFFSSSSYLYND